MKKNKKDLFSLIAIILIFFIGIKIFEAFHEGLRNVFNDDYKKEYAYSDNVFSIITTPENKVIEDTINNYFKKKNLSVKITYADNLDIVDHINSGEKYDAIWASNSIWLDMLDKTKVSTSESKSTSITPITFGIKKSKVEELGLKDKQVTMKDLLDLIKSGKLTFSMANPTTTNSGAASYINILSTLAGNPDVLTKNDLNNRKLQQDLKDFFQGVSRTSGDEDFLEKSFVNGDYDAAFTYESSIININKTLEKEKKETLYAIYPIDGVIVCDSPLLYIDNKNDNKKAIFLDFQNYILEDEGQEILLNLGRRTWYGGTTDKAPKDVFNKNWGIDTTKYISPLKYPSADVIKEALLLYQTKLRKAVHVVFCLDYSGSMQGDGIKELKDAMNYLFSDEAKNNLISFTENDIIDVIAFNSSSHLLVSGKGNEKEKILNKIENYEVGGLTALYPAAIDALELLKNESKNYNTSVILMTDGVANVGTFRELKNKYKKINKDIPIYSITFGDASYNELEEIQKLTNGKVFDGRENLISAFKTVRGYN